MQNNLVEITYKRNHSTNASTVRKAGGNVRKVIDSRSENACLASNQKRETAGTGIGGSVWKERGIFHETDDAAHNSLLGIRDGFPYIVSGFSSFRPGPSSNY